MVGNHGFYKDCVYYKKSRIFVKLKGYAIPCDVLSEMWDSQVIVFQIEKGRTITTTAKQFRSFGVYIHFAPYEPQRVLPLEYWEHVSRSKSDTRVNSLDLVCQKP